MREILEQHAKIITEARGEFLKSLGEAAKLVDSATQNYIVTVETATEACISALEARTRQFFGGSNTTAEQHDQNHDQQNQPDPATDVRPAVDPTASPSAEEKDEQDYENKVHGPGAVGTG